MTLADHRRALVIAKETLRDAKTGVETAKTIATLDTKGSNAEERKKADAQALLNDGSYNEALEHLRFCEYEVDRIEAEIDILKDERTARELACREENNRVMDRLATAYIALARVHPEQAMIDDRVARVERDGLPF